MPFRFRAKTPIGLKVLAMSEDATRIPALSCRGRSEAADATSSWRCVVAALLAAIVGGCSPIADPIVQATQASGVDAAVDAEDTRVVPVCGNGYREGDELCDDYQNPTPGFGCDDTCSFEQKAQCGDGVVTSPEVCDTDPVYCANCTKIVGSCGDGILQLPVEECDTKGESSMCDTDCTLVKCGDGVVNRTAQEVCDDMLNDGHLGSCTADCKAY